MGGEEGLRLGQWVRGGAAGIRGGRGRGGAGSSGAALGPARGAGRGRNAPPKGRGLPVGPAHSRPAAPLAVAPWGRLCPDRLRKVRIPAVPSLRH